MIPVQGEVYPTSLPRFCFSLPEVQYVGSERISDDEKCDAVALEGVKVSAVALSEALWGCEVVGIGSIATGVAGRG